MSLRHGPRTRRALRTHGRRCASSKAFRDRAKPPRYGTLRTWAEELGLNQAMDLLQQTLDQEEATDRSLTELAESVVNQEAQAEAA